MAPHFQFLDFGWYRVLHLVLQRRFDSKCSHLEFKVLALTISFIWLVKIMSAFNCLLKMATWETNVGTWSFFCKICIWLSDWFMIYCPSRIIVAIVSLSSEYWWTWPLWMQKKMDPSIFKIGRSQAIKNQWVEMGKKLVTRNVKHKERKISEYVYSIKKF